MIYDIITAGSATVDVFIKTHVSRIRANKEHAELMAYPVGQKILVEEMHQEIGGGGTNTAVAFSRMGFKTAYFGALAEDTNSKTIVEALAKELVDFIGVYKEGMTNYSVILDSQLDDRTILAYKDVSKKLKAKDVKKLDSRWLYMSSLQSEVMERLASKAKANNTTVVFNPSSYTVKLGLEKLKKVLQNTDILIFNKEEAQLLLKCKDDELHLLKKLGEIVDVPVITNGEKGAWVMKEKTVYHAEPKKNLKIVETTGAGDAFASGFISGLLLMKPIEEALKLGMLNSESVISHLGAKNILLDKDHAIKLLKKDKREVHKMEFK